MISKTQVSLVGIAELLASEAARISQGIECPIHIDALLRRLGITLAFTSSARDPHHAGSLRTREGAWEIVVVRPREHLYRKGLTPRERFTVAHEIGHSIVESRFSHRPGSPAEYWRLEALCNQFAATLLAPTDAVRETIGDEGQDAMSILFAIQSLRSRTQLSFEAASRRVIDVASTPACAIGLTIDTPSSTYAGGRMRWTHENRVWMGNGRNRKIEWHHSLAKVLTVAKGLLIGQVKAVCMPGVNSACVMRGWASDAYMVAALPVTPAS